MAALFWLTVAGWEGKYTMDIEKPEELKVYLCQQQLMAPGESLKFEILQEGVSNRAVWIERNPPPNWVLKQALEKLRVETDWYSSISRIHQEAQALRWLMKIIPGHVPSLVFEDKDHHILGMTSVPAPHTNWKTDLLNGNVDLERVTTFAQLLAKIHRAGFNYPDLNEDFKDYSFFESLRLEPYYSFTASQVPEASTYLDQLIKETKTRKLAVVHGDYSPKNVLLHHGQMFILDFEVMHIGDPAFDLGFSLTHFLSKAHVLPELRVRLLEAALHYWDSYQENQHQQRQLSQLEPMTIKHTLACMLARVNGRSPLEYLNPFQRSFQKEVILRMMEQPPITIRELVHRFEHAFSG
jgi:tRNA A-37 threonylcarbamoyl transferase component Bud32